MPIGESQIILGLDQYVTEYQASEMEGGGFLLHLPIIQAPSPLRLFCSDLELGWVVGGLLNQQGQNLGDLWIHKLLPKRKGDCTSQGVPFVISRRPIIESSRSAS